MLWLERPCFDFFQFTIRSLNSIENEKISESELTKFAKKFKKYTKFRKAKKQG